MAIAPGLLFEEMRSIKPTFIVFRGKLFGSKTNVNIQDKSAGSNQQVR